MAHRNQKWISMKIRKITREGIRGRKAGRKQAIAVAFSIGRAKHKK